MLRSTCSAAVAVVASLLVIAQRNPIYSVLLLIASFGALSGLYVLLDAPFVAVDPDHRLRRRDHGAVPVRGDAAERAARGHRSSTSASIRCCGPAPMRFGALLALALVVELVVGADASAATPARFRRRRSARSRAIGRSLFTDYAFPFEVTSVLILVAMVGAVVLAQRDNPRDRRDRRV